MLSVSAPRLAAPESLTLIRVSVLPSPMMLTVTASVASPPSMSMLSRTEPLMPLASK